MARRLRLNAAGTEEAETWVRHRLLALLDGHSAGEVAKSLLGMAKRHDLDEAMPGTQSGLDRHEWIKHGTCYGTSAEEYYADALDLMLALNTSDVAELFAGNIGRKITLAQVRQDFDAAFGPGAGDRVSMDCAPDGNRTIITELTIGLTGDITGPDDFAALIAAASPTDGGCRSGMVDPVGLR